MKRLHQSFNIRVISAESPRNKGILNIKMIKKTFVQFLESSNKNSELCRYRNGINKIVSIIKNTVVSDGEGSLHGHLQTAQDLLPVF